VYFVCFVVLLVYISDGWLANCSRCGHSEVTRIVGKQTVSTLIGNLDSQKANFTPNSHAGSSKAMRSVTLPWRSYCGLDLRYYFYMLMLCADVAN
jgi:hypothetical protein